MQRPRRANVTANGCNSDANVTLYIASLDTFHGRIEVSMSCSPLVPIAAPLHLMHGNFLVTGEFPVLWYLAAPPKKQNSTGLVGGLVVEVRLL